MRKLYSIATAIIFFIAACTKIESTNIGSGLIPPIDGVNTLDTTLDIFTNNYIDPLGDSAKVYKTDDHVIGTITNDPLLGKTTATAYFELKPTSYPFSLPNVAELKPDSAVLILSYKGVFGDTSLPQNQQWEVRELAESLRGDTVFNVSKSFAAGNLLTETPKTIVIPRLKDSVYTRFENASNQIRIKLSSSFATKLMKTFDSSKSGAYASDSLFRQNFKGFAVQPAAGSSGNALIRINLLDTNTKLALFYKFHEKDSAASKMDTAVSYFRFSDGTSTPVSGSGNYIKRDRSISQLTQYFLNTNRNDSLVFIQTMPGTFATLKIPGLRLFPNAIIHRAELLAFQAPDGNFLEQLLTPPRYLLLSSYDSANKVKTNVHNDFIVSSGSPNISAFGGYLIDKEAAPLGIVKAYNFDVSRYVQGIVTRKDSSYTLRLSAPSNDSLKYTDPYPATTAVSTLYIVPSIANNVADGRVRLGGGGMSKGNQLRMRLRIIYSKL